MLMKHRINAGLPYPLPQGDMALRLFRAIDREDMATNPQYATQAKRLAHGDVIDGIIADWG